MEAFRKKKLALAEEVYNQDTRSLTLMLSEKRIEVEATGVSWRKEDS